jgi:hypothetical protein
MAQGANCSIVLRTRFREAALPYAEETIREAVSLLTEEAAIEGDGVRGASRRPCGVTGCVVTPLTIGTAPLLLALALGEAGSLEFVSETRGLYRHDLSLLPAEDSLRFDLVQERGNERRLYEGCRVKAFELRVSRGEAVKLRLDVSGDRNAVTYPYIAPLTVNDEERFKEDGVNYRINGQEHKNIYGVTVSTRKEGSPRGGGGIKTEIRIHRVLEQGEIPPLIEDVEITARLFRNRYECRHYGMFRITLDRLVLVSDETVVDCADTVIGPLRYYVAGTVNAEVFTSIGETLE